MCAKKGGFILVEIYAISEFQRKLRVCAYARVSSGTDDMLASLYNQITHYHKRIKREINWKFAGIYKDEAFTGTKVDRGDFQKMLKKCYQGKIDMIITKSVTRFARNLFETVRIARELREIDVDIFFEDEDLHSINPESEYKLTLYAIHAQMQAASTSENMKWRISYDFQKGISWGLKDCFGYRVKDKKYIVHKEEAEVVKLIYKMYMYGGYGDQKISNILTEVGIKPFKKQRWCRSSVRQILTNPDYTGDKILQKTFRDDPITKHRRINRGEKTKFIVHDNHEPIITREEFELCQKIRKEREEKRAKYTPRFKIHPMAKLIKCGNCGKTYRNKIRNKKEVWVCEKYLSEGRASCPSKQIPHKKLMECICKVINREIETEEVVNYVANIRILENNQVEVETIRGRKQIVSWENDSRAKSWTEEMKARAREKTLAYRERLQYAK